MRSPAHAAGAELAVAEQAPKSSGAPLDERGVRAVCAAGLMEAVVRRLETVALPAPGLSEGASPVISAKILVQEAIRAARTGESSLRRIFLCCPDEKVFKRFEKTAHGYLRHFLDVLIWGPFVTVDVIIRVPAGVVLIERSNPPLGFALPGGFVDYGESLEEAVRREAREETGLDLLDLEQFHTYSDPSRDPRFHTITTVFSARAEGNPRAGDDAAAARVVPPDEISGLSFAFDHARVLEEWAKRSS
ncbi:MAG: NUDIX domain-containing protein [Spirochaetia bacterium]